MVFSSLFFLMVFLTVTIAGYYAINLIHFQRKEGKLFIKNCFLLLMSLIFYAWGGINYLWIIILTIVINYFGGLFIDSCEGDKKAQNAYLVITIISDLAILFFFKYFNMVIEILQNFKDFDFVRIALPVGISFFTFQAMSYVIDVYRAEASAQRNILNFALYVALFPQLIAGPIVKYSDIENQLKDRKETIDGFAEGIKRFCFGIAKKVLIANTLATVADGIWELEPGKLGWSLAWLGIVSYTLQIYYDFSGYSDMAIGLGRMFGFSFKENFNYPYMATSIRNFWNRWHISLTTWFREYVYIPLGGNRKGEERTYINILIVYILTGFWHGANVTFLIWGIYYALLQVIERAGFGKILDRNKFKFINWVYTMFLVMIGWIFFRSESLIDAVHYVLSLFSPLSTAYSAITYLNMKVIIAIAAGFLCSGFVQLLFKKLWIRVRGTAPAQLATVILQTGLLILSIIELVAGTYNPFIYYQF